MDMHEASQLGDSLPYGLTRGYISHHSCENSQSDIDYKATAPHIANSWFLSHEMKKRSSVNPNCATVS